MPTVLSIIAMAAYLVAIVRVLTYRKQGARHRPHVSWTAWALVAVLGGSAIEMALHVQSVGFLEACRATLLALFVSCVRGNVACLMRSWSK
ncbi:phage holin family protein [Paraburkholderia bonniea]|uniref:phage holin family protein n=1 Tax=Paraburkholderia bonniea TaxID=2152891 RepID=UPI0012925474|nr:phage holin family protein [Paraburkholderia bonniea]